MDTKNLARTTRHLGPGQNSQVTKAGEAASFADRFRLDGKAALVAGASPELVSAMALALGRAGANVAIAAPTTEHLGAIIKKVGAKQIRVSASIVTDPTDIPGGISKIATLLGAIDILAIGADHYGFNAPYVRVPATTVAERAERLVFNVSSTCDAAAVHMADAGSGSAIIVTNPVATRPWPELTATVLKLALVDLTKKLAQEWALRGLRFNIVSPGAQSDIPGNESTWAVALDPHLFHHSPAIYSLTDAVVWLASSAASRVTGVHIPLDGNFCHDLIDEWQHVLDVCSESSVPTSRHLTHAPNQK